MEKTYGPRLITVREAAKRLGLSRSKLYELLAAGELPSIVIGRNRRIDVADLAGFVDAHRVPGVSCQGVPTRNEDRQESVGPS